MPIVAALPSIGWLVFAAAVLLMTYAASFILLEPLKALARLLPIIGGDIANAIGDLGRWIQDAAEGYMESRIQAFTDFVDLVTGSIQYLLDTAGEGIVALFGAVQGLQKAAQGLQLQLQDSIGDVARDAQRALRDAGRGLSRAIAVAADLAYAIATTVPRLIDQAVAGVRTFARGIERDLRREIDNAVGVLRAAILGIVASQLDGIRTWVSSLITAVQRLAQEIEADLGRRIRALEHDLGHRLDGLARDLEGLQRQIGVIPLVGLVPWITSIANELTRIKTECINPGCNYLGPQLDALNAIQDAATIGIVAGLVAAAIQDPVGSAARLDEILSGADDLAREVMRATTGVNV